MRVFLAVDVMAETRAPKRLVRAAVNITPRYPDPQKRANHRRVLLPPVSLRNKIPLSNSPEARVKKKATRAAPTNVKKTSLS